MSQFLDQSGLTQVNESINERRQHDLANVAEIYDATMTYAIGDYCVHDNKLYICNTAIETAEVWTAAHWTEIKVCSKLKEFSTAIGDEDSGLVKDVADLVTQVGDLISFDYSFSMQSTPDGWVISNFPEELITTKKGICKVSMTFYASNPSTGLAFVTNNGATLGIAVYYNTQFIFGNYKPSDNTLTINASGTITNFLRTFTYPGDSPQWDTNPTANSTKPCTSGGIKSAIDAIVPGTKLYKHEISVNGVYGIDIISNISTVPTSINDLVSLIRNSVSRLIGGNVIASINYTYDPYPTILKINLVYIDNSGTIATSPDIVFNALTDTVTPL